MTAVKNDTKKSEAAESFRGVPCLVDTQKTNSRCPLIGSICWCLFPPENSWLPNFMIPPPKNCHFQENSRKKPLKSYPPNLARAKHLLKGANLFVGLRLVVFVLTEIPHRDTKRLCGPAPKAAKSWLRKAGKLGSKGQKPRGFGWWIRRLLEVFLGVDTHSTQPMDPEKKKSLNFIFPTKYGIPKSFKFSHWPSKDMNIWWTFGWKWNEHLDENGMNIITDYFCWFCPGYSQQRESRHHSIMKSIMKLYLRL